MRPPDSAPTGRPPLEAALFEFRQFPGRHALVRREPALLFASIPDVLQLAAGRSRDGLARHADSDALREAASFFVRTALLHPDANHYAVLGLTSASEPAAIKDHYRLMMRLMHPDFAADTSRGVWPADAAVRLNLAYEVLSTPVKRERYDEDLVKAAPKPRAQPVQAALPPRTESPSPAKKKFEADSRQLLKMLAGGFGAAGAIAVTALVVIGGQEAEQGLVQRPRAGSPAAPAASPAERQPAAAPTLAFEKNFAPAFETQAQVAIVAPAPAAAATRVTAELPQPAATTTVAAAIAKFTSPRTTPQHSPRPPQVQVVPDAVPPVVISTVVVAPPVPTPPMTQLAPTPAPPPAVAALAPPPAAAASLPPPQKSAPAVTMAEAHPLLSRLLQHIEAGNGERILSLLDGESRRSAAAQALLKQYNNLVEGGRPVKIANVDFKAQPGDGRLLVRGNVVLLVGEPQVSAPRKELAVLAEFALRDGTIVMTRLSAPE